MEKENKKGSLIEKFHYDLLAILDKNNVKYKMEKNKIKVYIKNSLNSDLPLVKNYNITLEEVKQRLKEDKTLTKEQLVLTPYQKKKIKELIFFEPPHPGKLNLQEVKNSSYIIT